MPLNHAQQTSAGEKISDSAIDLIEITPGTPPGVPQSRALWVGTGGDVAFESVSGNTVILTNIADGSFIPVAFTGIAAAGTTASALVALV